MAHDVLSEWKGLFMSIRCEVCRFCSGSLGQLSSLRQLNLNKLCCFFWLHGNGVEGSYKVRPFVRNWWQICACLGELVAREGLQTVDWGPSIHNANLLTIERILNQPPYIVRIICMTPSLKIWGLAPFAWHHLLESDRLLQAPNAGVDGGVFRTKVCHGFRPPKSL
jgi:hypothetical protein